MQEYQRTIISQYADSPTINRLIEDFNDVIDPNANFQAFYDLIWNVETAVGYGLDVWGRIVGISRILTISAGDYFGFAEAGDAFGFGQAPYYAGAPTTSNYTLTDEAYRALIFAKAAANITDCSIPAINRILLELFPRRGNCYVTDGPNNTDFPCFGFAEAGDALPFGEGVYGDFLPNLSSVNMTLTYVFDFPLEPFELAIVSTSGVLPKPVGVLASVQSL